MRDPSEFDAFYAGSVRRVTSHLYAMTGSRAEAEDLVQRVKMIFLFLGAGHCAG